MTIDKGIIIKNIYHMLVYAFKELKQKEYNSVNGEDFSNKEIYDLFAEILKIGASKLLRQGLYREYVPKHEALSLMRGKLDINDTIHLQSQKKQFLSCDFDEYSEDNIYNQILKSTIFYIIRASNIDIKMKKSFKNIISFFSNVSFIELHNIHWEKLTYQRNNKNYEMLINLCYFLYDGMLQTTEDGKYKLASFTDEQMHLLFQRFVFKYFKKEYKNQINVTAPILKWNDEKDDDSLLIKFLPDMKTDIVLEKNGKLLIIDTKYYSKIMTQNYKKSSVRSSHLYQIFSYVKNMEKQYTGLVSGMLLYAKTDEEVFPDSSSKPFKSTGNNIDIRTLDLNNDFSIIRKQLDDIVMCYFK